MLEECRKLVLCGFVLVVCAPSCVRQETYDAKVAELDQTKTQLNAAQQQADAEAQAKSALQARLASAQQALTTSRQWSNSLLAKLNDVNLQASELKSLAKDRQAVVDELQSQLQSQLALAGEFEALAREFGARTPEELGQALKELQQRVRETELALKGAAAELERERRISEKLKALIDAGALRVHRRAGRLVIELPGDIHFDAGKAQLTKLGETTLTQLAAVLSAEHDRLFVVEGHTDDQPIKVSGFRSNWHLGSSRAEVAREALVNGGVAGQRIAIASWADLLPVCTDTREPECLRRNRRVEVLLLPKFE